MSKSSSLKKQFIYNFMYIIIASIIFSIITYTVYLSFINMGLILPSNYYEKKVSPIINYIDKKGVKILDESEREDLEKIIPVDGMKYGVVDKNIKLLYGNIEKLSERNIEDIKEGKERNHFNEKFGIFQQGVIIYHPIKNGDKIEGNIILEYVLTPRAKNPKYNFLVPPEIFIFLSPIIYVVIFTLLFSRRFSKSINKPIQDLIQASKKIKERDLDFSISYNAQNELGELVGSFEEMRKGLSTSLTRQWEIENERRDMVRAIAHDLRTPLTIIKGHLEILQDGGVENKDRLLRYLDIIDDNTKRAIKLIEDMNMLAKIEGVEFTLNFTPVDIIDFIDKKSEEYNLLCSKKNIEFKSSVDCKKRNKDLVNIDKDRISQVLDNIVFNSFRFIKEDGSIFLYVMVEENKITIKISDDGEGFSAKDLKNIFKKFYQGDESRSKEKGHSGLGLYISKLIVEKHGGKIKAYNSEEGGANVEFYICF
ncbi:MAG: HAMP domain-containing sensor histidine kinase [Clostridiaceae bacterium]